MNNYKQSNNRNQLNNYNQQNNSNQLSNNQYNNQSKKNKGMIISIVILSVVALVVAGMLVLTLTGILGKKETQSTKLNSTLWYEDEEKVEAFVSDVLYEYVDAINTGDFEELSQYLSGSAIDDASENHEQITNLVDKEVVKSVKCYDVTPISENEVTVMRDSTIEVHNKNGKVKEVTETYLTTVEYINGEMKVTKFEAVGEKKEKSYKEDSHQEEETEEETLGEEIMEEEPEDEVVTVDDFEEEVLEDDEFYWDYEEYEIDAVVEDSVIWYVDAVNTGNTEGASLYFSGEILQTEINNASSMSSKVQGETLIDVNCHSYKRLSDTRVSVIRDTEIEIVELSGKSRVASESRVYVLENTGEGIYIVDIHK